MTNKHPIISLIKKNLILIVHLIVQSYDKMRPHFRNIIRIIIRVLLKRDKILSLKVI